MQRRWVIGGSLIAACVGVSASVRERPAVASGQQRSPVASFIAAERHDRSPALRDMPVLPPRAGTLHETPRFRRFQGPRSFDTAVQDYPSTALVPAPTLSFDGVSNINSVLPPDTNGDVGPNHFVQWVNLSFAVYSKGSATIAPQLLYGPAAGNTLWTGFGGPCETTNNGDPVVRYDHLADRWVMSQLSIPNSFFGVVIGPFYQCIAVSATSDPTGAYYRYQFRFDKLNDYPKFGVWPDAYYMTINQFSTPSLTFAGQGVVAFDRTSMLQGQSAGMVYFDLSSVDMNLGGMLPSDLDGPPPPAGAPNTFMQVDDDAWGYSPDQLQLWEFHVDWTTPSASSFTHRASLPTAPFDSNMCAGSEACIPQPGTTAKVDPLSDRLMYRLQYRNFSDHESLVVNHTVDADGADHAGIRWYEVRDPRGTPTIYQQGTYAPDADHRWMGSAAMDGAGNIAIGFSVSGTATFPSVRYAARSASDSLGTLPQGETDLVAGAGSQTHSSGRWGDYSMLTVDPSDDCTFWYTQEYYAATSSFGWQTRIGTFSLPTCVPPSSDLPKVTIAATTPTAYEAGQAAGAFNVVRTGDTSASLTVTYSIGGTATPGSDYTTLSGTVEIPAGSTSAPIAVVPIDDTVVEQNETVIVALTPGSAYVVGSPGTAVVTIVSDDVPPDLVISAATAPAVGGANVPMTVSDTTTNQGSGPSDTSTTGFYLSKDPLLDSSDVPIGTRAVPALPAGASNQGATSVTIPDGTAAGIYYILVKADSVSAIAETQEGNNTRSTGAVAIGPDLSISALTVPATAAVGGSIVIGDTTANSGGQDAPASTTAFYLSSNFSLDPSDVQLGTRSVGALASGTSSAANTTLAIPPGTAAGVYYVVAQADSANAIAESREGNNARFSTAVQIGADLAVNAVKAPSIAGPGTTIIVSDTTTNRGANAAPPSSTGLYLSTNFYIDSGDTFLGSRPVPSLAAGASDTGSTSVALPSPLATGSYYVLAKADYANQVAEGNENNNVNFSSVIRVGPDLMVAATTAPAIGGSGGQITIGDTTKNQGAGPAGASTTGLYLSTTAGLTASAIPLGSRAVPPLAAGATDAATTTVALPADLATGSYYVIASADVGNQVVETIETNNNGLGVLVRIGPDLSVSALTAPSSAPAGSSFSASDTVLNQGGGGAPASTTRYYLSTNLGVDGTDVVLGVRAVGALAAGQSDAGSATLTIPIGVTPGGYWLIAAADADSSVTETNETNNTRFVFIQVK